MASRNRTSVIIESRFPEWGAAAEAEIFKSLAEVTEPMAEAAKTAEVRRHSNALAESIHALPVVKLAGKIVGGIGAGDYKANWYEKGTQGRRRGGGKRGISLRSNYGADTGVKPLHFLRKGLYAGRAAAFLGVAEALRRARVSL